MDKCEVQSMLTNKGAKSSKGGKSSSKTGKVGGVWRTTDDGAKIFISGAGVRAGGPHGKVVGKAPKTIKPSAIDKKIAASSASKKSAIKPYSHKSTEPAKPVATKVAKSVPKKPDAPKTKPTKEKTSAEKEKAAKELAEMKKASTKLKAMGAKAIAAKAAKAKSEIDDEDPYEKYKKEQAAKEIEAMKKAPSKGVAKLPPNSKDYKEPPLKPMPPVDEKRSDAIYAEVTAKQRPLSPEHKKAATYYSTDEGYTAINNAYRSGGKVSPEVASLNAKAQKSKLPPNTVSYRGISKKRAESILAMGSMQSQGLVSTSTELKTAKKFTQDNHVLHIRAKTGIGIKSNSKYPEEQEILQAHGTQYKLVGTFQKELVLPPRTMMTFIDVEEV